MDPFVFISQLVLYALGANVVAATIPELFTGHLVRIGLSLAATLAFAYLPFRLTLRLGPLLFVLGLALLFLTLIGGKTAYGATRWLVFGSLSLQAAEFVKLFAILYLARFVERHGPDSPILGPVTLISVGAALITLQPKLIDALLLLGLAGLVLTAAGVPYRRLIAVSLVGVLVAVSVSGLFVDRLDHVMRRVEAFRKGELSEQVQRGHEALKEMRFFGAGPGAQMHPRPYLGHNDMAFIVLAHALGAYGVFLLFFLYTAILIFGLQTSWQAQGPPSWVALGITAMLFAEIILHLAVNLGLMPVTGLPLPFISQGGSALVSHGAALGVLYAARREAG